MTSERPRWLVPAAAIWLLVVGWATLRSDPAAAFRLTETSWHCIVCGEGGATDVFLNVLLFAPLGVLARAAGWRVTRTVVWCALLSTAIECTQGTLLVGRDATLGDVIANTGGALLGWSVAPWLASFAAPATTVARRRAAVLLALSAVVWLASGWGLRPSLDGPAPWTGQVLHRWPGHDRFAGTFDSSAIDGIVIPNDPLAALPPRRDTFDLLVDVTRRAATVPARPVSIVRIVDRSGAVQVGVSQSGNDLILEARMRASRFRVRTPEWRFRGAMAIPVGVPWRFRWRWRANRVELLSGAVDSAATVVASDPLSIAMGWVLIHPFTDQIDRYAPWWTVVWTAWWFALAGWCGGAAGPRAAWWFGAGALVVFALAAFVTAMTPAWYAVIAGVAGYGVAARLARHR